MLKTIRIDRWCVIGNSFDFKHSTPAIYFKKKEALECKKVYYPNRKDIKICKVKLLIIPPIN